jgi:hypothetical protein
MNANERGQRDIAIMKLVHAGVDPLAIAKQHRLTLSRVNQIIEREKCQKETLRRQRSAKRSGAHAVKAT